MQTPIESERSARPAACLRPDSQHPCLQPSCLLRRIAQRCLCTAPQNLCPQFWKEVVEGLAVSGGAARFKGTPLVTAAGPLTVAADMPDGAGIH